MTLKYSAANIKGLSPRKSQFSLTHPTPQAKPPKSLKWIAQEINPTSYTEKQEHARMAFRQFQHKYCSWCFVLLQNIQYHENPHQTMFVVPRCQWIHKHNLCTKVNTGTKKGEHFLRTSSRSTHPRLQRQWLIPKCRSQSLSPLPSLQFHIPLLLQQKENILIYSWCDLLKLVYICTFFTLFSTRIQSFS